MSDISAIHQTFHYIKAASSKLPKLNNFQCEAYRVEFRVRAHSDMRNLHA